MLLQRFGRGSQRLADESHHQRTKPQRCLQPLLASGLYVGAKIALQTGTKKAVHGIIGKVATGITVGATSYSVTARVNAGIRALIKTV